MANQSALIYQLKITLLGLKKPVWRRIQIPESYSFWDLHVAIQCAMGWLDCHLHIFVFNREGKRTIISGDPYEDDFSLMSRESHKSWDINLSDILNYPGDGFLYEYDIGYSWAHGILLEGVMLREKGVKYPRRLAGERACPPEDCGGIPGYEHMLEVMASPKHPERKEVMAWLGIDAKHPFLPEQFDPAEVKFSNPKVRLKHFQEVLQEE